MAWININFRCKILEISIHNSLECWMLTILLKFSCRWWIEWIFFTSMSGACCLKLDIIINRGIATVTMRRSNLKTKFLFILQCFAKILKQSVFGNVPSLLQKLHLSFHYSTWAFIWFSMSLKILPKILIFSPFNFFSLNVYKFLLT